MNNKITVKIISLEWVRIRGFMIILFFLPLLLLAYPHLPYSIMHMFDNLQFNWIIAVFQPLLPILAGLLLGAGIITEDIQNNTIKQLLSLPVKRSRIWFTRHIVRLMAFGAVLALWYIIIHLIFQTGLTGEKIIMTMLVGCLVFASGSLFSNLMENNFSSIITAISISILTLFLLRKSPLAYPHIDKLIIFAIIYFMIISFDLFTCGHPLNYRSLWKRAGLWFLSFIGIVFLSGIILKSIL